MKVLISADMEGISGIILSRVTESNDPDFQRSRMLMTADVNAAVQGAVAAGATEVWVNDSHGSGNNILIEDLHPSAQLIQGWPELDLMASGVDETFDALFLVGYHARMLTEAGTISHTMTGQVRRLWYNDVEVGEFGISAAHAGDFGVPMALVTGDEAVCEQVRELLGETVEAVSVKTAYTRECVRCLPLEQARALIRDGAKSALKRLAEIKPYQLTAPVEVKMQFHKPIHAAAAAHVPTVCRVDNLTVAAEVGNGLDAARMVDILIRVSG